MTEENTAQRMVRERREREAAAREAAENPSEREGVKPAVGTAHKPGESTASGSASTPDQSVRQPDPTASVSFLDDMFGKSKRLIAAIRGQNDIKARHFEAGDQVGQQKFITDCSTAAYNIYFSINWVKGTLHSKPVKTDIADVRCLAVDLDPPKGDDRPLAEVRPAMLALLTANLPAGIPRPNRIVDSGRGYWGFWFLTAPQPVDGIGSLTEAVESYARGLVQAFAPYADPSCAEISRVARLPGTINRRTGEIACVLHEYSHDAPHGIESFPRDAHQKSLPSSLISCLDPAKFPPKQPKPELFTAEYQAEIGYVHENKPPLDMRPVLKGCPLFRESILTGGKEQNQGVWMLTALACTFGEDGRKVFHALSNKHPGYTPAETDAMFDRKEMEQEADSLGWPSCRAFEGMGARECAGCPHRGEIKSPLNLALPASDTAASTSDTQTNDNQPQAPLLPPEKRKPLRGGTYSYEEAMELINSHFCIGTAEEGDIAIYRILDNGILKFSPAEQFKLAVDNILVQLTRKETKSVDRLWKESPQRHQKRIVFKLVGEVESDEYNLWHGFGVEPRQGWRKMRRLMHHIWKVMCKRDKAKFKYCMRWLAWAVQHPDKHPGTVLVFINVKEGTGKSTLGDTMVKIFGQHGAAIEDSDRLLGRFVDWLEPMSFILAEEILWAGDHKTSDRLKQRITGDKYAIERKNGPTLFIPNRLHAMMTGNHEHAVFAGVGARRVVVYEISSEHWMDASWFGPLYDDLDAGGRGEFLHFLLNLKLGKWHPRTIIRTDETIEQQRMSADSIYQWSQTCINEGGILTDTGPQVFGKWTPSETLRGSYITYCKQQSLHPVKVISFSKACKTMFGEPCQLENNSGKFSLWGYNVPTDNVWQKKLNQRLGLT